MSSRNLIENKIIYCSYIDKTATLVEVAVCNLQAAAFLMPLSVLLGIFLTVFYQPDIENQWSNIVKLPQEVFFVKNPSISSFIIAMLSVIIGMDIHLDICRTCFENEEDVYYAIFVLKNCTNQFKKEVFPILKTKFQLFEK